ncbi:hypothetical protein BDR03DRAFT_943335 [Suillus americanus]|nr:hypothetical protein BDR03DRAFT_943335 [Suillus americanus]
MSLKSSHERKCQLPGGLEYFMLVIFPRMLGNFLLLYYRHCFVCMICNRLKIVHVHSSP